MHWALQYLGMPWVSGHDGPDSFDCWGLVRYIQKQHFNRHVSAIAVDAENIHAVVQEFTGNAELARWRKVVHPVEGDCLLLSQNKQPTHVGIWLDVDGGGLLHAVKSSGVIFTSPANIKHMGYNVLGAYECVQP